LFNTEGTREGIVTIGRPRTYDIDTALEAAMKVFWRLGYEGASLNELTKAMGINSPSLYAAFGSKEGLFKAVLDHYEARRQKSLQEMLAAPTARAVAECLLHTLVDLVTDPDEPPGCLFLQGGLSCGVATPEVPHELARRRGYLAQQLRVRLERAQAAGDLPASADPSALSRYLASVCDGIAIQAASGASREELHKVATVALNAWPQ
jgi:AcrR family transcriptional regulator